MAVNIAMEVSEELSKRLQSGRPRIYFDGFISGGNQINGSWKVAARTVKHAVCTQFFVRLKESNKNIVWVFLWRKKFLELKAALLDREKTAVFEKRWPVQIMFSRPCC